MKLDNHRSRFRLLANLSFLVGLEIVRYSRQFRSTMHSQRQGAKDEAANQHHHEEVAKPPAARPQLTGCLLSCHLSVAFGT